MNRTGALLLAGCLIWAGAACRAEDKTAQTPRVSTTASAADTAAPTLAAEVAEPASADCAPECSGHGGLLGWTRRFQPDGHCARRLWDWLTYCPQSCPRSCSECGRVCAPTCAPPFYQYFLWHCDAAAKAGHGCGGAAPAPVAELASPVEVTTVPTPAPQ